MQAVVTIPNASVSTPALEETRETLLAAARRCFGPIPGDFMVDHVLRATVDADFPVREAALAALERRCAARSARLTVIHRALGCPRRRPARPFGLPSLVLAQFA